MAERKALALIDGKISEVPASDTIRGAGSAIPELYSDPISPSVQSAWVRATTITAVGEPLGLLLAITKAVGTYSYELRYRTLENITIGVTLT